MYRGPTATPPRTKEPELTIDSWKRLTADLEARRLHLFASAKRGTAVLAPPYVIGEEELAAGLARLLLIARRPLTAPTPGVRKWEARARSAAG